ncbi:uncharacterized protein LOC135501381 [Lineus longissimus]|uniref:uncharacterized protein LOC135501381 n=1 Tax=Lineus longissimus TaxID=88925 RepID=UPI002B4E44F6
MPVKKQLDLESLEAWVPKSSDSIPPDRGPLEHVFIQMFSMREKMEAMILGAAPMGQDPHSDARQTILCLAKMLDQDESSKTTRGIINADDQTEGIVVDVIAFKGKKVWTLGDDDNEPIVFVRYAYHTADFQDDMNNPVDTFAVVQAIGKSMPPRGATTITCASREEMRILKKFFEDNAGKISPSLRNEIEGGIDKMLMLIPLSYTSYLCPLPKPEANKEMKYCKVCGSVAKKVCTKCKVARYCSKECQVQDWRSGHKCACKPPEEVALEAAAASATPDNDAKTTENPWVDFDPKKTPSNANYFSTISHESSVSSIQKNMKSKLKCSQDMFEGIKTDKMLTVKVQIPTGSHADDFAPIVIYPQGKKFALYGVPQNIVKGRDDYRRIHNLVKSRGFDGGLGMGGGKIYLDAYVTTEGLLRVMLNDVKPMQKW